VETIAKFFLICAGVAVGALLAGLVLLSLALTVASHG
jgi:hypothetical protein